MPLFSTESRFVPKGSDNRPRIAEEAAARAKEHHADYHAEIGKKTQAEITEDRRARLPDNVRPSKATSRAGQYFVKIYLTKDWPYSPRIRSKFKVGFSVVKPGTDGYYASTKAAAEVRDEWIELERPESWMAKEKW